MTGEASWNVQRAVYSALTGASALTALLADGASSVYDDVPENATFPYITLGEGFADAWEEKDNVGQEHDLTIHTWSRYEGFKECKQIMQAIYDALNRVALTVTGQDVMDCRMTFAHFMRDPDGETRHGVQRVLVYTSE